MFPTPGQRDRAEFDARLRALGESERVWAMDALERLWEGKQYLGRPSFWDRSVPVQERAPCIVHPIARIAASRLASLVFGDQRFPRIAARAGAVGVGNLSLSEDECKALGEVITDIVQQTRLKATSRSMLIDGLKVGTGIPVVGLRAGVPTVELLPAKWCCPEFSKRDPNEVVRLVEQYRRAGDPERYPGEDPAKSYWYRREITETTDCVWDGVEARSDGKEPKWDAFDHSTIPLEFNPVVWGRNLPDSSCHDQIDGIALAEGLGQECEALDLAHSMRHRNALYNGDPLPVVSGAGPEDVDAERGRQPNPQLLDAMTHKPAHGVWQSTAHYGRPAGTGGQAIAKGAGSILWLRKDNASASLLETSGAGNKVLGDDADAIRTLIYEAMSVVAANPEAFASGDLSSRALALLFRPMIDLADNLRDCWGVVLIRVISKLLRLCLTQAAVQDGVFIRGIDAARPILSRFVVAGAQGAPSRWIEPPLVLTWGPYFEPSRAELQATAQYLSVATGNQPFLSRRSAIANFAAAANLDDAIDAEQDRVSTEQGETADRTTDLLGALVPPPVDAPTPDASVADSAMNGAQVASLQAIVIAAAAKQLPLESARAMIAAAFPALTSTQIDAIVNPLATAPPAPAPPMPQPSPPPPPDSAPDSGAPVTQ